MAQRQNVSAQIRSRRVGTGDGAVPLEGARDAPLLASKVGVPRGNGTSAGGDEAAVGGEVSLVNFLDGEDTGGCSLLELEDLDVRGAILEMHNGPDSIRTGGVAGLEERHEILHVGNLGVAVCSFFADRGVVCEGGGLAASLMPVIVATLVRVDE